MQQVAQAQGDYIAYVNATGTSTNFQSSSIILSLHQLGGHLFFLSKLHYAASNFSLSASSNQF